MTDLTLTQIILLYFAVINVATFFTYGLDKWKAKRSKWRITEAALLMLAVLGGSIGAWLGMKVWHHKTQHKKFRYGIPAIIILQAVLIAFLIISFLDKNKKTESKTLRFLYPEPEHNHLKQRKEKLIK